MFALHGRRAMGGLLVFRWGEEDDRVAPITSWHARRALALLLGCRNGEREMTFSTRLPLKCFVLAVLIVGLFAAPGAARATAPSGTVVAWGCSADAGQCSVPSGLSGVTAVAAGSLSQPRFEKRWHRRCLGLPGRLRFRAMQRAERPLRRDRCRRRLRSQPGPEARRDHCGLGLRKWQRLWAVQRAEWPPDVTAIAAGMAHSLALKADGTVVAWGCGGGFDYGQCSVPNGLSDVTAIAAELHPEPGAGE